MFSRDPFQPQDSVILPLDKTQPQPCTMFNLGFGLVLTDKTWSSSWCETAKRSGRLQKDFSRVKLFR